MITQLILELFHRICVDRGQIKFWPHGGDNCMLTPNQNHSVVDRSREKKVY